MALIPKNPNEALYVGGKKHFQDVIKNRGAAEALIYREPEEDFNNNSTLIVEPGEQAVFVKNGQVAAVFQEGSHILSTDNYPFLTRMKTMITGGISKYNCIILFVRKTTSREILWGDNLSLVDPIRNIMTEFGVNGAYRVTVEHPNKLIASLPVFAGDFWSLTGDVLPDYCSRKFLGTIKSELGKMLLRSEEDLRNAATHLTEYSEMLFHMIAEIFSNFGLKLLSFSIAALEMHRDENRKRLEEALARKAEMGILGSDWDKIQAVDVMKGYSQNPGPGGMAGGIAAGMSAVPLINRMMRGFSSGLEAACGTGAPQGRQTASEGEIVCGTCGTAAQIGQNFCSQCGKPLKVRRICPACGTEVVGKGHYCGECGRKMDE